jgi:hypothetical protein
LLKTQGSILGKMGKLKGEASILEKVPISRIQALSILDNFPNCIDQGS